MFKTCDHVKSVKKYFEMNSKIIIKMIKWNNILDSYFVSVSGYSMVTLKRNADNAYIVLRKKKENHPVYKTFTAAASYLFKRFLCALRNKEDYDMHMIKLWNTRKAKSVESVINQSSLFPLHSILNMKDIQCSSNQEKTPIHPWVETNNKTFHYVTLSHIQGVQNY